MEPTGRCIDGDCPSDRRKAAPDAFARNSVLERECSRLGHATRQATIIARLALCTSLAAYGQRGPDVPASGDAHRGRLLLHQYGCGTCHTIPGVARAHGTVGPPLDDVRRRVYLARNPSKHTRYHGTLDPAAPDTETARGDAGHAGTAESRTRYGGVLLRFALGLSRCASPVARSRWSTIS